MTEQMGAAIKEANASKPKGGLRKLFNRQGETGMSTPLLAFTFFYTVSIYTLLLSFYFWQIRTDIKPEK